jgi:hypothetical protein
VKQLGAVMLLGMPTAEVMKPILTAEGVEDLMTVPMSMLIAHYQMCRNFGRVAEVHQVHRPDLRRAIKQAQLA